MKKTNNIIVFSIVALVIGVVSGIIYAPESGQRTRKKIRRKFSKMEDEFSDLSYSTKEVYNEVKDTIFNLKNTSEEAVKKFLHHN
jgi:gas vesicle protein